MTSFCKKHCTIITPSQFGFRKSLSSESTLLIQKEIILRSIEGKLLTLGIFIDFTKAFDRINHLTLLNKLESYGFRGVYLHLIKRYPSFRRQKFIIDNEVSGIKQIKSGVPQGSILGPLLFNIYINNAVNIDASTKIAIYADDTTMFFISNNTTTLITKPNNVLATLNDWSMLNSLNINSTKTKAVLFRAENQNYIIERDLLIGTSKIEIVPCVKSL